MIDYLEKEKKTIDKHYDASELNLLEEAIKSKNKEKRWAGVLLSQDNIPVHTAGVAVAEEAS